MSTSEMILIVLYRMNAWSFIAPLETGEVRLILEHVQNEVTKFKILVKDELMDLVQYVETESFLRERTEMM